MTVGKRRDRQEVRLGKVKFWHADDGWGALVSLDLKGDVFVHFSAIQMPGYRELVEGQTVEFRCTEAPQDGCQYVATQVRVILHPSGGRHTR
jgi:cold shock protein